MNYPVSIIAILIAALVPLVLGAIWFNPSVLGKAWMKASGMTEEKAKGANIPLIMVLSFVFNFFIAFILGSMVVHQTGLFALLSNEADAAELQKLMEVHGDKFRSFGHGVLHGVIAGLFFATPMIATHALYERRGFKYIAINGGYWIVSLAIMGGIICAWH